MLFTFFSLTDTAILHENKADFLLFFFKQAVGRVCRPTPLIGKAINLTNEIRCLNKLIFWTSCLETQVAELTPLNLWVRVSVSTQKAPKDAAVLQDSTQTAHLCHLGWILSLMELLSPG